ncbi:hypothetical protein DFQ28_002563 [Apophysomyces sp. BC1034]|nr:hypothetical protein DFQ30_006829 [Apophysomyces sp. BC1015]KAG0181762.1 hypothetical protein DFQ29_007193 [Apophysomyces sp. BC1021]KAG0193915.1 hypothetical protein DFQ28_002563 [Apophysomyces sp. BC1034]
MVSFTFLAAPALAVLAIATQVVEARPYDYYYYSYGDSNQAQPHRGHNNNGNNNGNYKYYYDNYNQGNRGGNQGNRGQGNRGQGNRGQNNQGNRGQNNQGNRGQNNQGNRGHNNNGGQATQGGNGGQQKAALGTQQDILNIHNQMRAAHDAPPLKWSNTLASFAQSWSDKCVFKHSGHKGYGENLAYGYPSWNTSITAWYDEYKLYNYNNPGYNSKTGHFTQIVWKDTTEIGCGVTNCPGLGELYTCSYTPQGNIVDYSDAGKYFRENVLP